MLQGEVEKTIKSFPQIENARIHITPAQDSVFVKDKEPGKAAVYIELKTGEKLKEEQVKSIISLVSGTTENMPKNNIEVIDQDMNLVSQGLFDESESIDGKSQGSSVEKQQGLQKTYEDNLEKSIYSLLEPVVGKGKVKAKVNASLDFDSKQKTDVVVDPNKVIKSQHTIKDNSSLGATSDNQSPVDNNMSNTTPENNQNGQTKREEQTTEYEMGKTENKVISAPGEVKRITSSVVVDGVLDQATEDAIKNIVESAVGFKQDRGDQISIVGMTFDPAAKAEAQKQLDTMKADEENAKKAAIYRKIEIGVGVGIVSIIAIILIIRAIRRRNEEDEHEIDMMINNSIEPKEVQKFEPINFETKNENTFVEEQVKKYAEGKPEQVLDVIKAWIAEDER
jgi:flagellar M-ring protein FliF